MLRARVVTALLLLATFLGAVFGLPQGIWIAVVSVLAGACAWEWRGLLPGAGSGGWVYAVATALASAALAVLVSSGRDYLALAAYASACAFWLFIAPVWLARKWRGDGPVPGMIAGWVVLLPACLALVQLRELGPWFLLAAMALVWVADTAAYAAGRSFGRRKLAPSISPGKTWEGAIGGALGVLFYGFALTAAVGSLFQRSVSHWALLAAALLVMTALSILGDLFESLLKRQAGVKDSGNVLPGHGGLLDRVDSLTSTLPWVGLTVTLRELWW